MEMPVFLKSRATLFAGVLATFAGGTLHAQMHKVEKPEKVTRAVGVYEWTGEMAKPTAARLIPVSLFIDGHFEDAGVYLARPVPFTLETGDEYSIERAGRSLGTFDIDYARDVVTRRSVADDDPVGAWYGYGRFVPPQPPKKNTNLKPSVQVAGIVGSASDSAEDDQPKLLRRADSAPVPAKGSAGGTANPAPEDDPDRPTLRHRDPADAGKQKRRKESGSGVSGVGDLNNDPDRPTLRRGVPVEDVMTPQLSGLPPALHQAVAVSDATSHDPHEFDREWATSTEKAETLKALEALAQPKIAAYVQANKLVAVAAGPALLHAPAKKPAAMTPAQKRAAAKKAAAAAPAPAFALTNEVLKGYELTYGGLPVFVYTVETPLKDGGPVYLTMVAQRLPTGELQVGLATVTDATDLDRSPWMRPVDVVDPDWSHRGQLLMELRAQSSRQFALYRLVTAEAEQTFETGVIE
jgi:hypothetical protein